MQFGGCKPDYLIMPKRLDLDDADIVRRYKSGESQLSIATSLGITSPPIFRRLQEAGASLCSTKAENTYNNMEWLIEEYVVKKRSGRDIARGCGVGHHTIFARIDKYNIERSANQEVVDLSGQRFGRLVAISLEEGRRGWGGTSWECRCDCGSAVSVLSGNLVSGHTQSCGCLNEEIIAKFRFKRGEEHPNWSYDKTDEERKRERSYPGYKKWRKAIVVRDNYTCQKCMESGGDLRAHHIESHNLNKGLRLVLENGITLCAGCHKNFHRIYGLGNNTSEQFNEFMLMDGDSNS